MNAAPDHRQAEVTEALMPVLRRLVKAEAEKIAARPQPVEVRMARLEIEIMNASRAVAEAADDLKTAQFMGAAEIPARRKLEKAADRLLAVMKKHGRA